MTAIIYDLETYLDASRAGAIYETKDYKPSERMSSMDKVPAAITKLKSETLREQRTHEWKMEQSDKIQASIEEQKKKDWNRSALHWTTGKIVSVSAASLLDDKTFDRCGHNEAEILAGFVDFIDSVGNSVKMVGKSNRRFDDGFLVGRLMVNNIKIPYALRQVAPGEVSDIDQIFGWGNAHPQQAKLEHYCIALGLGGKLAKGSDVHKMVEEERWEELAAYNKEDTALTKAILKRYCDLCKG